MATGSRMETTIWMDTYKPIKKWVIPILSIIIGLGIGFSVFPSKQEYYYNSWLKRLDHLQGDTYEVKTLYKRDDRIYSRSQGVWSPQLATYNIATPISDGTDFTFAIYFSEKKFYINSGEEWKFGEIPHRLLQEFIPLDHPFKWTKEILKNADKISVEKDEGQLTYRAYFNDLNDIEFRGVILQEQKGTRLEMNVQNGQIHSIKLTAKPIRPDTVGPLVSYPEELIYELEFERIDDKKIVIPPEAQRAEELE
jgi:hypothetical protein